MRWLILRLKLRRFMKEQAIKLGTAQQAIEFAVTIDDHYDMRAFLDAWLHGETETLAEEWPEYQGAAS